MLLRRPYPPHTARRTNSKFGGLPRLPKQLEWPRTPSGIALHFLAQIDCADIGFGTCLPERGVLFFFGHDDEDQVWNQIWDETASPFDDCRVLYALNAFAATPTREAPPDLRPIGGSYPGRAWQEFLRDGEPGPSIHVEWPIEPVRMDSWPDALFSKAEEGLRPQPALLTRLFRPQPAAPTWQELEARDRLYSEKLDRHRAKAYAKATGEQPRVFQLDPNSDSAAGRAIFAHAAEGPEAYPQHWIAIHYAARALLHRPANVLGTDPAVQSLLVSHAEDWLRRSDEAGLDELVSEEVRREFRTWLASLRRTAQATPLYFSPANLVFQSMIATIRAWAGDPVRSARIPEWVYAAMRFRFDAHTLWGMQYSQMLGHAPSAQEPLAPDDPTICLLNLASEYGAGWMFGDVGNCSFWIEPADLARKDFDKVWGTIEGH